MHKEYGVGLLKTIIVFLLVSLSLFELYFVKKLCFDHFINMKIQVNLFCKRGLIKI